MAGGEETSFFARNTIKGLRLDSLSIHANNEIVCAMIP